MKRKDFLKSIGVGGTLIAVAPLVAVGSPEEKKKIPLEDKIDRLYPNIVEMMKGGEDWFGKPVGKGLGTFHLLTEILDNKAENYWGDNDNLQHNTIKVPAYSVIFRRSFTVYEGDNVEDVKERERLIFYRDINEYIDT